MDKAPIFYLLPNKLHPQATLEQSFTLELEAIIPTLDLLIAETPKEGRAFLKPFFKKVDRAIATCPVLALNEHTDEEQLQELVCEIVEGKKCVGFVSDAGLPILADPGAVLVRALKLEGVTIRAFTGPSSITHALMLSGFSGQHFTFHGYLPKDPERLRIALQALEQTSLRERSTQIFIERPYRNNPTLSIIKETLKETTELCVAIELMGPKEKVETQTIKQWRSKTAPNLHKKLVIYLLMNREESISCNHSRGHVVKKQGAFRRKRK